MQKFTELFGISIPSYAFFAVIGFCAAILFAFLGNKDQTLKWSAYYLFIVFAAVGMLLGSKMLFFITILPTELNDLTPKETVILFLNSGFVFYGELFGALGGRILSCKILHEDMNKVLNIFIPPFVLFHTFGRIGCFFAGCCGIECKQFFSYPDEPNVVGSPVQLAETLGNAIIIAIICYREKQ